MRHASCPGLSPISMPSAHGRSPSGSPSPGFNNPRPTRRALSGCTAWARCGASPGTCPGIDPANEIPPLGLVTFRRRWRQPFIYSDADIVALMEEMPAARPHAFPGGQLPNDDRPPSRNRHAVGEVIALTRADIDWGEGVITVQFEVQQEPGTAARSDHRQSPWRVRAPARPGGAETGECGLLHLRQGDADLVRRLLDKFRELVRSSGVGAAHRPAACSRSAPLVRRQHACPVASGGPGRRRAAARGCRPTWAI